MMSTNKYTFMKLIEQYLVEIPIIQRDYAQGRTSDKVIEIRNNFLDKLYSSIIDHDQSLDFDFVYGNIEEHGNRNVFIPLDGQQRLTTLFLLHWYLANKDEKIVSFKSNLSKFTYETRASSRAFCNSLVNIGVNIPALTNNEILSEAIINEPWYFLSWENDPTIKAMLVMLDAIHDKFKNSSNLFERLTDYSNPPVTFQFLSLKDFGLTDNLYITMNARGKQLTDFENFKAKFEQFLEITNSELKDEFSKNIDGNWTDIFWKYKEDNVIDKPFMRYFFFITEMLYFSNINQDATTTPFEYVRKNPKVKFDLIFSVYSKIENISFLVASLHKLSEIKDIPDFFSSIFSNYQYEEDKVALFDNKINLFQRCLEADNFELREKILLFSILKYSVQLNISDVDQNIKDFIRVVRNLLQGVRTQKLTKFESNLRVEFLTRQLVDISSLIGSNNIYLILNDLNLTGFSKESVAAEKVKINFVNKQKTLIHELEDNNLIRGFIYNFDIENNLNKLPILIESINEIWTTKDDSLIVRAMLTLGDYTISIQACSLGNTYLFGNSENWHTILTKKDDDSKTSKILPEFLILFDKTKGNSVQEKLQLIIKNWVDDNKSKDWRYYFIKYKEMTSWGKNYYSWRSDYEIRNLGSYSNNPLVAYHINPYIFTVANKINDISVCNSGYCYGRYLEESPLVLGNGLKMYCRIDGWLIVVPENFELLDKSINKFKLEIFPEYKNYFLLKENDEFDRIEIAVEFVKDVIASK